MKKTIESRVRSHLHVLDEKALLRTLRAPSGIDLASNDYIGLASHPLLKKRMIDAIDREGCGSCGGSQDH